MKMLQTLFIFLFVWVTACDPQKDTLLDSNQVSNKTSASSELYFRNVRSLYYSTEELPDGKRIYMFKEFDGQTRFSFSILHDWRENLVYPILEADFLDSIRVSFNNTSFPLNGNSGPINTMIATHIYNEILQGREVILKSGDTLFQNERQRQSFRKSYYDFLRLVDLR